MTDHPPTPFGIPWNELPDDLKQALIHQAEEHQRAHDLQNMAIESSRHRMIDFLDSLDEEQMNCLRGMLTMVVRDTDRESGGYWLGITAAMMIKFDVCPLCLVKHETEDDVLKAHPAEAKESKPDDDDDLVELTPAEIAAANADLMEEYGLKVSDQFGGGGYECKKCGTYYSSIHDRMLRPPDGCEVCKTQTKWGGTTPDFDPDLRRREGGTDV